MKRNVLTLMMAGVLAAGIFAQLGAGSASAALPKLVGTWNVHVPESAGGSAAFDALHTYNDDGTMTETSSLLAGLGEGPAHGAWKRQGNGYNVTFDLFIFDESHAPAGMVRVRTFQILTGENTLKGNYAVDLIATDGSITRGIDSGEYTATRLLPEAVE